MSVIVKNFHEGGDAYYLHMKGSPEKLRELCRPETIPVDFHKSLNFYA